ncbi:hypothetical protein EXIGLDRAFT_766162 [Exidia glandulosa HHB12029]|uniref:Uncharacterized protein n=1 Tax=Exidia glandulosa HHB12029 TaxID=1314781 RepID=A0A165JXC4_EXIGL|nr:hypothetical protein EXIGLDRAFT_766162 [Exidia glandulosa HHB12029]
MPASSTGGHSRPTDRHGHHHSGHRESADPSEALRLMQLKYDELADKYNHLESTVAHQTSTSTHRHRHSSDSDSDEAPPHKKNHSALSTPEEETAQRAGQATLLQAALWLHGGLNFRTYKRRDSYNKAERWTTPDGNVQAQLRGIEGFWPGFVDFTKLTAAEWKAFKSGLNAMRTLAVHRTRADDAHEIFGERAMHMHSAAERKAHFAELIGYQPNSPKGPHYSAFHVPILHRNESAVYQKTDIFLHPYGFRIYIGVTRAHLGLIDFLTDSKSYQPKRTIQDIHEFTTVTPAAVAACYIWARFALSEDPTFLKVGKETHIPWEQDYNAYLKYLEVGLAKPDPDVRNIMDTWNRTIYGEGGSAADPTTQAVRRHEHEEHAKEADDIIAELGGDITMDEPTPPHSSRPSPAHPSPASRQSSSNTQLPIPHHDFLPRTSHPESQQTQQPEDMNTHDAAAWPALGHGVPSHSPSPSYTRHGAIDEDDGEQDAQPPARRRETGPRLPDDEEEPSDEDQAFGAFTARPIPAPPRANPSRRRPTVEDAEAGPTPVAAAAPPAKAARRKRK